MGRRHPEILQGTLDLMVLKALEAMGPLHGYAVARRIEQISDNVLQLNEGTVYASLLVCTSKAGFLLNGGRRRITAKLSSIRSAKRAAGS